MNNKHTQTQTLTNNKQQNNTMPQKKQDKSVVLYAAAVLLLCLGGVFAALLWWRRNDRLACRPSPHSHHAPKMENYAEPEPNPSSTSGHLSTELEAGCHQLMPTGCDKPHAPKGLWHWQWHWPEMSRPIQASTSAQAPQQVLPRK